MADKKTYQAIGAIGLLFLLLRLFFAVEWATLAGLTMVCLALLLPWFALQLANVWYALGNVLGKINSFILMSIIYWLVVVPIGFLRNLLSKKELPTNSTFIYKEETYTKEYFNNPW
jgi:hypothetical protein